MTALVDQFYRRGRGDGRQPVGHLEPDPGAPPGGQKPCFAPPPLAPPPAGGTGRATRAADAAAPGFPPCSTSAPVLFVIGVLLAILAAAMLVPALVDLASGNPDWERVRRLLRHPRCSSAWRWRSPAGVRPSTWGCARPFLLTTLVWVTIAAFGALPFVFFRTGAQLHRRPYFEAMSGITTTGSTVIVGLDRAPPGPAAVAVDPAVAGRRRDHRDGDRDPADAAGRRHAVVPDGEHRHVREGAAKGRPDRRRHRLHLCRAGRWPASSPTRQPGCRGSTPWRTP